MFGKGKKKDKEDPKQIKIVDISDRVNGPKNKTMWCSMHNCTKTSCPKMHD